VRRKDVRFVLMNSPVVWNMTQCKLTLFVAVFRRKMFVTPSGLVWRIQVDILCLTVATNIRIMFPLIRYSQPEPYSQNYEPFGPANGHLNSSTSFM